MEYKLTSEEKAELSLELEKYSAIFYKFWTIGNIEFVDTIDTAAVFFDKDGNYFKFQFNLSFWKELTLYEKIFVICHEMMHIILHHGVRSIGLDNKQVANIAMDIVINKILVNGFLFNKEKLPKLNNMICWFSTFFKNKDNVKPDQSMEYYYDILNEKQLNGISIKYKKLDSHDSFTNTSWEDTMLADDLLNDAIESLNDIDKQIFGEILNKNNSDEINEATANDNSLNSLAGNGSAGILYQCLKKPVSKKKKW